MTVIRRQLPPAGRAQERFDSAVNTLADFDFRSNSIGFLRLLFASMVVFSHSFNLGGFGPEPLSKLTGGVEDIGTVAVDGFFVLSGLLITRSFEKTAGLGSSLWHRVLRIFPAFWVCLFAVAFGFAPLMFMRERATFSGFLTSTDPPWHYVTANAFLVMRQYNIAGLLANVPYPSVLNHSLWTLQYEFYCYLAVGALGTVGLLNRRPFAALMPLFACAGLFCLVTWVRGLEQVPTVLRVLELYSFFSIGACAYLFRDRIPIRGTWALASFILIAIALQTRSYGIILLLCLSYLTIYTAMRLPFRNFDKRVDLSYGLYIYAFPTQQLLTSFGVPAFGFLAYLGAAYATSLALAAFSWFGIERTSLSLKYFRLEALFRKPLAQPPPIA